MEQKPAAHPSLLDAVQHEVGSENSPLLEILTNNARFIVIGIIAFIAAIGGYWAYESNSVKSRVEWQQQFGEVIIQKQGQERLDGLKAYLAKAPEEFHFNTWLAIIQTAGELKNPQGVLEGWEAIARLQPSFALDATMGKVNALMELNKPAEAVALLKDNIAALAPKKDKEDGQLALTYIYGKLAVVAELSKDFPTALDAYRQLLTLPKNENQSAFWAQKVADLETKVN